MDFNFNDPIPLIQRKKKYASFKVTLIGGPDDIKTWREMQAAKETSYRMRLGARDTRITQYEVETGVKLEEPQIITATWAEKEAFAYSERKRLAKLEEAVSYPPIEPMELPKKPFWKRVVAAIDKFWSEANF